MKLNKHIEERESSEVNLIDYLFRKKVVFCVIQANGMGGIMDNFIVVHDSDYKTVEDRFQRSKGWKDCLICDLEGEDYRAFKHYQNSHFKAIRLNDDSGTVYEILSRPFKTHRVSR